MKSAIVARSDSCEPGSALADHMRISLTDCETSIHSAKEDAALKKKKKSAQYEPFFPSSARVLDLTFLN